MIDDYNFVAMIGMFTQADLEEKLGIVFSLFDEDYSTNISKKEMGKIVETVLSINEDGQSVDKLLVQDKMAEIRD